MAAGAGRSPRTLDRLRHVPREVGFEVVEDHHVPPAEFPDQPDPRRSGTPACRSPRGKPAAPLPIQGQGRDHGRRTPRGGHRALGPLTPPCPGVGRRHRRADPRLVDENQPFCLDSPHLRPVSPPLGLHLGSVPLAGMQGLLLVGQAEVAEGAAEGRQDLGKAAPHSFSCFRVASGCSAIRIASRTCSGKPRSRPRPAAVGLGGQGTGVPTPLE